MTGHSRPNLKFKCPCSRQPTILLKFSTIKTLRDVSATTSTQRLNFRSSSKKTRVSQPRVYFKLTQSLTVRVDAEYLRNADKISWVKSFKDVYQKFVASYQQARSSTSVAGLDALEMPCFYVRNQAMVALFKIDSQTRVPKAELVPSLNLSKLLKDRATNLNFTV